MGYSQVVNYRGDYVEFSFAKADYGCLNVGVGRWRLCGIRYAPQTCCSAIISNRSGQHGNSVGENCRNRNGERHHHSSLEFFQQRESN
jgi:hypothetical protein